MICFYVIAIFVIVRKGKEKQEEKQIKLSQFLKAHIYLGNTWHNLVKILNVEY